jgi:purine-cytosine permease-like protein
MANDGDDAAGDDVLDEPYVPSGLRRSTFRPSANVPAEVAAVDDDVPASVDGYDDDDLANALAEQLPPAPPTGSIPVVTPRLSDFPAPSGPPQVFPAAPVDLDLDPETGLLEAPRRRSLDDADLLSSLSGEARGPDDTLSAIDRLESQMRLREQEAREFGEWQDAMLAIGTPEALRSLDEARPAFTGVIDIIPTPPTAPAQAEPDPSAEPASLPTPSSENPAPFDPPVTSAPPSIDAVRSPFAPPTGPDQVVTPEALADTSPVRVIPPPPPAQPPVYDLVEPSVSPFAPPVGPSEEVNAFEPPVVEPSVIEPVEQPDLADEAPEVLDEEPSVPAAPSRPLAFDDLLAVGAAPPPAPFTPPVPFTPPAPFAPPTIGVLPLDYDEPVSVDEQSGPIFIEPVALLDPGAEPLQTGSHAIISKQYEAEHDEDVDDTDRAFDDLLGPFPVSTEGVAELPPVTGSAPIQPMSSPRVPVDELVLDDDEPTALPAFALEASGPEPTPLDHRVGRAARMFWLWFATNTSVLSVGFGAALLSLGMSLRQAIVAAFLGVALSFLPLGLGTLAGKWSGQPTMITSRATFGVVGNVVPAVLAVVTRLFWGAVLLWLIAISTAHILVGAKLNGPLSELQLTVITMAVGFLIALVVALFGYSLFARIQLVLSVVSAVLVIGLVLITWPSVNITAALSVGDGPWILVVTGVVLVFSFVGLAWANSSGDLARYQRPSSSGAAAMLWAPFGTTLPAFLLIAYGALLAASDPTVAHGLLTNPLDTIALMIPIWYPVPLIVATVLSLLSGVVLSIYSGGFALQAVGLRVHRAWSSVIVGAALFAVAVLLSLTVGSMVPIFRDLATTLAVPVAAWAGIFAAEMIIRRRRFDSASLLKRGGVYPTVNWVNLAMLVVASAIGFGLTTANIGWLSWQGYLFTPFGVKLSSDLAGTDIGVLVALVLGMLTPFVAGVSRIRGQEQERVTAL